MNRLPSFVSPGSTLVCRPSYVSPGSTLVCLPSFVSPGGTLVCPTLVLVAL